MIHRPTHAPLLEGRRIRLRGLLPEDLTGRYFGWFNDQEVCRFNSHARFPNSMERMESYYRHVSQSKNDLVLAITDKSNDEHVGNVSLQGINWVDRSAEFAIIIGERRVWGTGVGTEAALLIVRHGFETLNLHRIHCGTTADNEGMKRLAQRMQMKEEGRRREAVFKRGAYRDVLEFGVLRHEFGAASSAPSSRGASKDSRKIKRGQRE